MSNVSVRIYRIIKNEYVLLTLILLLGFTLRLYKVNSPLADWHSWRQADTASVTRIYIDEGLNIFFPRYYDISSIQTGEFNPKGYRFVEFPIYNIFHYFLVKYINVFSLETWGRLLSSFCSLVTAVFLYLIAKKFINKWGGLLSAFYFLILPYNIFFSRVILPEPMAVMFVVIAIYFFVKFITAFEKTPGFQPGDESNADISSYFIGNPAL